MRRPLCMGCLVFAAAVGILQGVWKPSAACEAYAEGQSVTVTGKVCRRETKVSAYYGEQSVLYLQDISSISFQNCETAYRKEQTECAGAVCTLAECLPEEGEADGHFGGRIGSIVTVQGQYAPFLTASVPGGFDQAEYYRMEGYEFGIKKARILEESRTFDRVGETLERLRGRIGELLDEALGAKDGAVLRAMLLGEKKALDGETKKRYQEAAISHILCISGLHITLLGMGLYRACRRLPFPEGAVIFCCILVMWLYGRMVGMGASALRAILMFAIGLTARAVGRSYDILTALAAAAVCILAKQPLLIRHSGFLLSFGAVMGLSLLTPLFQTKQDVRQRKAGERLTEKQLAGRLQNVLAAGLGVFFMTLPVMVQSFYEIAPYSLLLNLFVVPLGTVLLPAGLFVPVLYLLWPPLAEVPAFLCHVILAVYEQGSIWSMKLPGSRLVIGHISWWQTAAYYLLLLVFLYLGNRYANAFGRALKGMFLLGMIAAATVHPDAGEMRVVMLDVGQGDCFLVQQGHTSLLIDGGSSSQSRPGESRILPALKYYGVRDLDYIFVSHTDEDHVNGIRELLETGEIRCDMFCLPESGRKDDGLAAEEKLFAAAGNQAGKPPVICRLRAGDRFAAGKLRGDILHPSAGESAKDGNSTSMVIWLSGEGCHFLFMGDLPQEREQQVVRQWKENGQQGYGESREGQEPVVLKAGHHGSDGSTTEMLLETFSPSLTLISCGKNNSYGHPGREMLSRTKEAGSAVLVTAWDGTCVLTAKEGRIVAEKWGR